MSGYEARFAARKDELEWLYKELYGDNRWYLDQLENTLAGYARERPLDLRHLDDAREAHPGWYLSGNSLEVKAHVRCFSGDLATMQEKIPYLKEVGATSLRLAVPFRSHGGLVEDFDELDPRLGTKADLQRLCAKLLAEQVDVRLELPMNSTASTHAWAVLARRGNVEFRQRYVIADDAETRKAMAMADGVYHHDEELGGWIFSSAGPGGWDLSYHNPVVLNEMIFMMCRWANLGVTGFHLIGLPYLWKEPGTLCRDLPRVHTLLRIIRLALESVAPSVVLSGESGLAMSTYFGTRSKPECHVMDDKDLAANLFSALASQDARVLRWRTEDLLSLPSHCVFTASLGGSDPISWHINAQDLKAIGLDPAKHQVFLYQFFEGTFPGSYARGRLYGYDPVARTASVCGTPASLCGIEAALAEGQGVALARAIQRLLLLGTTLFSLKGVPSLQSGDEIAQLNDLSSPDGDARTLLQAPFDWDKAASRNDRRTVVGRVFSALSDIALKRGSTGYFAPDATVSTWDAQNDHVLAIRRVKGGKVLLCLSNFSDAPQKVRFSFFTGMYRDLFTSKVVSPGWGFTMQPLEYLWLESAENSSILDARETVG